MDKLPIGAVRLETYKEFIQAFVDIDPRLHRIYDGAYILNGKLYYPASMLSIDFAAIGSGGERVGPSDALGRKLVTEASAAQIQAYAGTISNATTYGSPRATVSGVGSGWSLQNQERAVVVPLAAVDGAGAVAATVLIAGPAGYYPVIDSVLVVSDVADATTTFTFGVITGALAGKAVHILNLVADVINTALKDLLLYNVTDASSLTVAVSGGTAGALIWVQVDYHFET